MAQGRDQILKTVASHRPDRVKLRVPAARAGATSDLTNEYASETATGRCCVIEVTSFFVGALLLAVL